MTIEVPDSQPITYLPGVDRLTGFRLRENGVDVSIAAGSFSLLKPDGTIQSGPTALTGLPSTTPSLTVPAGDWGGGPFAADVYGGRYVEAWTLDGELYTREAWASLVVPVSPLTDEDLERMHSGILAEAPDGSDPGVPADPVWSGKRLQAWKRLQARLLQTSIDQSAIVSWFGFLDFLAYDTLALIAGDLMTEELGAGKWTIFRASYMDLAAAEWDRLGFGIDRTRDLIPDAGGPSQVNAGSHLGGPQGRRW